MVNRVWEGGGGGGDCRQREERGKGLWTEWNRREGGWKRRGEVE